MTDAFWLVSSASTDSWVRSLCWQIVGSVLYVPGDMGDQEITFADVDWSEDSHMEECDPGAPLTEQASSGRNPDYTHEDFAHKLKVQILPNDQENRGEFDVGTDFRIGDPNVHFRAAAAMSYETIEEVGKPDWNLLFGYILTRMSHLRFFSTVYVLTSPTLIILTPPYSIGLQWQPGGPAVLACRALLENSVMWFSSLSAKPVAFIWFTIHGPAPSSWQPSAWSFLVYT